MPSVTHTLYFCAYFCPSCGAMIQPRPKWVSLECPISQAEVQGCGTGQVPQFTLEVCVHQCCYCVLRDPNHG